MKRIAKASRKLNWTACAAMALCATAASVLPAQTFTTLYSFENTNGIGPWAGLVQAANGNFYGTTTRGGAIVMDGGLGTVFEITPGGTLTTLYDFCPHGSHSGCPRGLSPYAGLVQATDGNFYGTTKSGGAPGPGTVFRITPGGSLTTLHSFCSQPSCADGKNPEAALIQATGGNLYGTTQSGGASRYGTVFKVTLGGTLTTLYSFCAQTGCADGEGPFGDLVQATNGDFYGTTLSGGANGQGTVFEITAGGTLTTLYSFCSQSGCTDGDKPLAGLIQATDGNFYGTTRGGGIHNSSCVYHSCGTVFKITPSGSLTTLYTFCSQSGCADGANPESALVQATDGNFYATTVDGGAEMGGTVFKITPAGALTTLYSFCSQSDCTDGYVPHSALVQATNGDFYGTTFHGGSYGAGTVFSLSVGLVPFAETQPASRKANR